MDWNDRDEVFHMIRKEIREAMPHKYCPVCKDRMSMIKIRRFSANADETESGYIGFRCMGCLKIFTEELKEIE